jgi:hypothetical protein
MEPTSAGAVNSLDADLPYLDGLGFVIVDGAHAGREPQARLLVALRAEPTLAHFDPEWLLVYVTKDGRGKLARLERPHLPAHLAFAWGEITIFDRLGESNMFVTFGGTLTSSEVADGLSVVRFASPAPILRWAGHSQPSDPLAADVEAFFARLLVPIDFVEGAERIVSETSPLGLYAAVVADLAARLDASLIGAAWRQSDPDTDRWVGLERARLRAEHAAAWAEGLALLERLGIRPAAGRAGRTPGAGSAGSGS